MNDDRTRMISLDRCIYQKDRKMLSLSSECIGMPASFFVKSNITGRIVKFTSVQPGDDLFDPDGWDGEACYYRPMENLSNVEYLVISNHF